MSADADAAAAPAGEEFLRIMLRKNSDASPALPTPSVGSASFAVLRS
jgi:hypothetical protein